MGWWMEKKSHIKTDLETENSRKEKKSGWRSGGGEVGMPSQVLNHKPSVGNPTT